MMKSRVLYVSKDRAESAKQIAEAIARGAKISCDPIEKHTRATDLDVLFLGSDLSFGKIHNEMYKFASSIDPSQVKQVVAFSVSHSPHKTALAEFKAILEPKGIKVNDTEFYSPDKVTDKELEEAQQFGKTIMAGAHN